MTRHNAAWSHERVDRKDFEVTEAEHREGFIVEPDEDPEQSSEDSASRSSQHSEHSYWDYRDE
jgi:hypothetical protein